MMYDAILLIVEWIGLIALFSILPLFLFSLVYPQVSHFLVTRFGTQTIGTVISSQRCDDREDVCVCGVYRYQDRWKWEHQVKFRYGWHWPGNEEWEKVMQSCGLGAENIVYYLPWFPLIREIQWNVDNPDRSESLVTNLEK
jgi:hypothetical protein